MSKILLLLLSALVLALGMQVQKVGAQVRINEFIADNVSVNPDMCDFDDFSDWIELYNTGSSQAEIGGYYLTGDLKQPKKAAIPAGTTIPAKGYLLFWADGHNAEPGQSEARDWYHGEQYTTKRYHVGFKLDKNGEQVGLFDASGKVVDSITFGKQVTDVSMGRTADGKWAYFDHPTPAAANTTPAKQTTQLSGTVTFSPAAGGFSASAQSVALTASDGSDIYYTLDGSIPYEDAEKYSGAIPLSSSTVIRARCIASDKLAGRVVTNTYFKEATRKLMVVNISTDSAFLNDATIGIFANYYKYREIPVCLEFFTTDGKQVAKANAGIQVGSLTNYDDAQKPLQVSLKPKYGDDFITYQFFNRPYTKFNRLRLRQGGDAWETNFIADDLLDPISYQQMEAGVQAYCPVVAYINGKYYGLMDLREQFRDQYFMDNYGLDATALKSKDEIRRNLVTGGLGGMNGISAEGWEVVSGSWSAYGSIMQLVKSGSINYGNVTSQIDINSKIDFVVMESFACNSSWGHNEDFWKVPDGKWRWLTTDIDRGFEYSGEISDVASDIISNRSGLLSESFLDQDTLFGKLMGVAEFKNHFVQRYAAHLNSTLKGTRLNRIVDSIVIMLDQEISSEATKWGSQGGLRSLNGWKTEIGQLQKFCTERGANVLTHLAKFAKGGTSKLTVDVVKPGAGVIFINGVRMSEGLSGMTFFNGIPLAIKATGVPGCTFKSWSGAASGSSDSTNITLTADATLTAAFDGEPLISVMPSEVPLIPGLSCIEKLNPAKRNTNALIVTFSSLNRDNLIINLYNLSGQKLGALMNAEIGPGVHTMTIPMAKIPHGVYLYRLQTKTFNLMRKVIIR